MIYKFFHCLLAVIALLPSAPTANGFVVPTMERPPIASIDDRLVTTTIADDEGSSSSRERRNIDRRRPIRPAWRIALDFGRSGQNLNPLDNFGASGIRFPLVIPAVEFTNDGLAVPRGDTVSYTDIRGGVTRPIEGGTWAIIGDDKAKRAGAEQDPPPVSQPFQFTLRFPEEMRKGDVVLPADTTLLLEGLLYSQHALKRLDEAFIAARSEEWKAEESLEDIYKERDGPKRWNPDTQRWERPKLDVPLSALLSKHWTVFTKKQERQRRNAVRPRTSDMSKQGGRFPGFDNDDDEENNPSTDRVHMGAYGVIRTKNGGMVVGSWSAEPVSELRTHYDYNSKWR